MYEKLAVFAAAYKFTDKCIILVEPVGEQSVGVYFKSKSKSDDGELRKIAEQFCNEVLDQQLRLDIEKKYGNIRDLIVEHAFSPISNIKDKVKI
jgi:His-Xaa-Ser system protein HxsD